MEKPHFRVLITFIAILIFSFLLITYQIRIGMFAPSFRKILFDYLRPVEYIVAYIPNTVDYVINNYRNLFSQAEKIRLLKRENLYLKNRLDDLYAYKNEFSRLESLLGLSKDTSFVYIPAKVIGMSGFIANRDLIVDQGFNSNINLYDPIISEKGLLGYVVEVYDKYSVVRTTVSNKTAIAVYFEKDGTNGIVKGNGTLTGNIFYVPQNVEISLPQRVFTSGMDGIFPRNIFVGNLIKYEKDPSKFFYDVFIELNSSPFNSKYLYIIRQENAEEQDL